MEDIELLRRYVRERSEDAFHELVRRKLPLVYSAALRQVGGDVHRANDVTQAVFTALARQAKSLVRHPSLTGWLYKTTRYAALAAIRTERRRQHWENESSLMNANDAAGPQDSEVPWCRIGAVLDEAMHALNERDREAVLLRYFADQSHASIGKRLGLSEDAARKRIDRALDRLQQALARRGVVSTASALMAGLAQGAITAVPTGLAAITSTTALTTTVASGTAGTGLAFLTMSKTTMTAATALAVLALGAYYQVEASRIRTDTQADALTANQRITVLQADVQGLRQQLAAISAVPPVPMVVVPPNPDDELIARLTALSRTINEGGLANRVVWEKPTLVETVGGIAAALEVSPNKISLLQKISEDTRQEILANALRAATVTRDETGGIAIRSEELTENQAAYDRMLQSFSEIIGPARYAFFESLNAKQTIQGILEAYGLASRTIKVFPGSEGLPGYRLFVPTGPKTIQVSMKLSREDMKTRMGPFSVLIPDDF